MHGLYLCNHNFDFLISCYNFFTFKNLRKVNLCIFKYHGSFTTLAPTQYSQHPPFSMAAATQEGGQRAKTSASANAAQEKEEERGGGGEATGWQKVCLGSCIMFDIVDLYSLSNN